MTMSARSRPPTDEQKTAYYDPEQDPHRARTRRVGGVEIGTPTEVTPPAGEQLASGEHAARPERSEPIRVISMKAAAEPSEERPPVRQHQPRLRRLSEVTPPRQRVATPPGGLGYLAPPRDPREARTRHRREYLKWGSAVVILAVIVMLGVWFLAGM
jgi:hypothetical protein